MGEEKPQPPLFLQAPWRWGLTATIIGSLALTGVGFYQLYQTKQSTNTAPTTPPTTPPIIAVTGLGRLEPEGEVIKLSASSSGQGAASKIDQILVKEGEKLKIGQVVAILDNRDRLQAAVEKAKQQVEVSRANLAQVKAGAKSGEIAAQQAEILRLDLQRKRDIDIQSAEISRLQAQLKRDIDANIATVARNNAELQNARKECDRYEQLYKDGAVTASNRDSKCLQQKTAQEQFNEATAILQRVKETSQQQIRGAQSTLTRIIQTGREQINSARATLNKIAEVRPVDIKAANIDIQNAIASLKQAEEELKLAYIKSPIEGQVLKIRTHPGETISQDGIIEIGKTDQMYVIAEIYESDINKVTEGKKATITSKSFDWTLKGSVAEKGLKVAKKDVLNTDPTADVDSRIVEVKIRLDSEDSKKVSDLTYLKVDVKIDL